MAQPLNLDRYRDKHRLLIILGDNAADERVKAQEAAFAGREADLNERDMLIFVAFDDEPGKGPDGPISPDVMPKLRERFDVPARTFAVVLIGKDGTAKHGKGYPVPADEIFELVDAMPMRQAEQH